MEFAIFGRHPSCCRSGVFIRSLSRNPALLVLRGEASVTIEFSHRDFAKIAKYRKRSIATPLSTVLTACNAPQRVSRRSASTDRLSSVGLSNSLLVGRITIRVNGMTEPSTIPPTSHQTVDPERQDDMAER